MSDETSKTNGSGTNGADKDPMVLEALAAYEQLRTAQSVLYDRLMFMRQAGLSFEGDRDLYAILGYDRTITNKQYRDRYDRGGIAGRIVDAFPNATWRGAVEVIEDEDPKVSTPFEEAWATLDKRLQVQAKLLRVDKLAGLSTYAVLLIGVRDKAPLEEELPRGTKPEDVIYLTPFSGGGVPTNATMISPNMTGALETDCSIAEIDLEPSSPRYGLPKSYWLRRINLMQPSILVHWSRIIHIAEGVLDNEVYGQPALMRVWNLLDDLDKVTGGGAEAFWLRANQGMHVDIDKDMALPDAQNTLTALKEQVENYKHGLDRWLRTRGVNVDVLGSDVANFSNPADAVLTQIAGAKAIPKRILTGSEMGELASSQDRDNWKDQVNGRQTGYAGPYIVRPLVDRLIAYGYLPTPAKGVDEYQVVWPHIEVMTETEKAAGAAQWATVNKTQGEIVFTNEEMRDHWYGFEPLKPEEKQPVAAPEKVTATPGQVDAQQTGQITDVTPTNIDPKTGLPRAASDASDESIVRLLTAAIEAGDVAVVTQILGLGDVEGHPFHGNQWTTGGGGVPHEMFLSTPSDAIVSLQNSEPATVAAEDVRGVLQRAAKLKTPVDLTNLTIEGRRIFAGGLNRDRLSMPQIPKEQQQAFFDDLKARGIAIKQELVAPASLLPTQNEINAVRVGQMLEKSDKGEKDLRPIMISKDNYVLDGHHRWAVLASLDVEQPKARIKMPVFRIMQQRDVALRSMERFNRAKGIKHEALERRSHA